MFPSDHTTICMHILMPAVILLWEFEPALDVAVSSLRGSVRRLEKGSVWSGSPSGVLGGVVTTADPPTFSSNRKQILIKQVEHTRSALTHNHRQRHTCIFPSGSELPVMVLGFSCSGCKFSNALLSFFITSSIMSGFLMSSSNWGERDAKAITY